MTPPPTIDLDPHEKPRPTRGEAIFVVVVTTVVLVAMALALKFTFKNYGTGVGLSACGITSATLLAIASWLEWKKRRRLWRAPARVFGNAENSKAFSAKV